MQHNNEVKNAERERLTAYIKTTTAELDGLRELREALNKYDKKIVDKRFFELNFTNRNEAGEINKDWHGNIYTKYRITPPRYNFSRHSHEMFIAGNCTLELNGRERQHILAVIEAEGAKREEWLQGYKNGLAKLETLDEPAIIADLLAVYEKHGRPEQWQKILDIYEVKYPKENDTK